MKLFVEANKLYCLTRVYVFEDYEYEEHGDEGGSIYGKFIAKGDIKDSYNPLDEVDILSQMMNLLKADDSREVQINKILEFSRRFGLLGNIDDQNLRTIRSSNISPHFLAFKEMGYINAITFIAGIREAASLAFLSGERLENSKNLIKHRLMELNKEALNSELNHIIAEEVDLSNEVDLNRKDLVTRLIRRKASFSETVRVVNGEYVPAISFHTLTDVAYYQLVQSLFDGKTFKRCLNCGAGFIAKHQQQKFCAPLPNRTRSTCQNTHSQRQIRLRKKQEKLNN